MKVQAQREDLKISGGELQVIVKELTGRAGGTGPTAARPLEHVAKRILRTTCRRLGLCLKEAGLPAIWKQSRAVGISKSDGGTKPLSVAAAAWNDYDCQEAGRMDRRVGSRRNRAQAHRQAAEIHSRPEAMERARISGKCVMGAKLDLKKCFDSVVPFQAIR